MNKYVDKMANMVVLGSILSNPCILEEDSDKYHISQNDFTDRLHKICFVSINNLVANGLKEVEVVDIYNYIKLSLPSEEKYFLEKDGQDFLNKCLFITKDKKFEYYYARMKKFSLLREYTKFGVDVKKWYDPDTIDFEQKSRQEAWLDSSSADDIIETIDKHIEHIKDNFKFEGMQASESIGDGIFDLLKTIKETPAVGLPLPFGIYNTIVAGARLKKVFLTSAPTGLGKTRSMLGAAAYLSCGTYYSSDLNEWIDLGWKEPSLFISTELEKEEMQTMALAFIANVNEAKILGRENITFEEEARVQKAAQILSESKLYLEVLPDFSIDDIERTIKVNIEKNDMKYCFFDYIHTSMKILAEVSQASKGVKLREDNVLFMLAVKLKDLANKYGIFLQTGTQVNRSIDGDNEISASMLRGASAIADKMDYAEILTRLSEKDKEAYQRIYSQLEDVTYQPNMIRNIYKNRGNKYSQGKIWCYSDLGTCRIIPLFYTTNDYELIKVPIFNVKVVNENDK